MCKVLFNVLVKPCNHLFKFSVNELFIGRSGTCEIIVLHIAFDFEARESIWYRQFYSVRCGSA